MPAVSLTVGTFHLELGALVGVALAVSFGLFLASKFLHAVIVFGNVLLSLVRHVRHEVEGLVSQRREWADELNHWTTLVCRRQPRSRRGS
jgi:hypothetical protein